MDAIARSAPLVRKPLWTDTLIQGLNFTYEDQYRVWVQTHYNEDDEKLSAISAEKWSKLINAVTSGKLICTQVAYYPLLEMAAHYDLPVQLVKERPIGEIWTNVGFRCHADPIVSLQRLPLSPDAALNYIRDANGNWITDPAWHNTSTAWSVSTDQTPPSGVPTVGTDMFAGFKNISKLRPGDIVSTAILPTWPGKLTVFGHTDILLFIENAAGTPPGTTPDSSVFLLINSKIQSRPWIKLASLLRTTNGNNAWGHLYVARTFDFDWFDSMRATP